ncbi:relaxase/mobilization nuclease domain-containing protein [Bifidobacterium amazonense]|uniref:Relaxase/mobilization nuclease domain-containing protein n=1 Tax=Bifidobacterium amazonense TaxID=2809027 RepID=A0ABS9VUU6_9BIFI|nr:relaxase/mobilization nuclease domain-containing protein [Bifidobacterium amazonense]MCH9275873.1 relaxase/mobilization nuclease domain-containing protein [Bifidobacterium amazonense]
MSQITATLHKAIAYITNPAKTEQGLLVSSTFSDERLDSAVMARRMLATIERSAGGERGNGVLAHHVVQSFSPEDSRRMTARQLHELGIRFADEFTGGEYAYVIATHVDRGHTHNHIIICATSDVTFRKMRTKPGTTIRRLREISDRLCAEHGLNVLPELRPERGRRRHGVSLAELYASAKGDAIKDRIRAAIDTVAGSALDFDSFSRELRRAGVTVAVRGRHLTFTDVASGLRVRDMRLGRAEIAVVRREDVTEDLAGRSLIVHGKGSKDRIVPLTDELAGEILASPRGWLFPHVTGRGPVCGDTVYRRIKHATGCSPHTLRHRFATAAYISSGGDIRAVQELLGHESLATTQAYVTVTPRNLRSVVDSVKEYGEGMAVRQGVERSAVGSVAPLAANR